MDRGRLLYQSFLNYDKKKKKVRVQGYFEIFGCILMICLAYVAIIYYSLIYIALIQLIVSIIALFRGIKAFKRTKGIKSPDIYENGLVLVAIYTNLKNGWGFETGYKLTEHSGIATISDGYLISEIDDRPALDVYDEWLNGELYEKLNEGEFNDETGNISFALIKQFTLLNPIARVLRTEDGRIGHYTVSPIPSTEDVASKNLRVFAEIQQGWEIALYRGTWQTHMNRVETIPNDALERAGLNQTDLISYDHLIVINRKELAQFILKSDASFRF